MDLSQAMRFAFQHADASAEARAFYGLAEVFAGHLDLDAHLSKA
jgi:hypothetical protein